MSNPRSCWRLGRWAALTMAAAAIATIAGIAGIAAPHAAAVAAGGGPGLPPAARPAAAAPAPAAGTVSPPPTAGGRRFDPVAATDAYLVRLTPQQKARSDAYFEGGYWLFLWDFLYGAAVILLILATGLSGRMRDLAAAWAPWQWAQTPLYAVQYLLVSAVLTFPFTWYGEFVRERAYGLATQDFGAWFLDQCKALLISLVLGGTAITLLYAVLRRAPRTWWLWGALVSILLLTVVTVLEPVYIDPFFNKYTELRDPAVREPILRLARANAVPAEHVWAFDASRQTTRVSANVAGLLGTTRIALNDNLLRRCTLPEIEAVMGHEMGHYVLHHVSNFMLFLGVLLVAAFAFMNWSFDRVRRRWGARWRIWDVADPAGLPLFLLLLTLFVFLLTPVINTYKRTDEAAADAFGLNAARQPDGQAEVALMLGEYRKLSPGPIEEWVFYDHPSGRDRILTAMRWKAEHLDEPPVCHP
jgi:STE24 endopeptidase